MTTIHAGSARQALTRLRFICQLAETGSELPLSALNTLVSEAVDVVVHSERGPDGPRVMSVLAVEDLVAGVESTQFTVTEVFARRSVRDQLEWTGVVPSRLAAKFDRESAWVLRVFLTLETGMMEHGNYRCAAEAAEVSGRAA
jgi:pilus assembly protein CpaF